MTFDLCLWPSSSVKVTFIFIIRWTLCCCVLVPSVKFVSSIEFEIWKFVWRKPLMTSLTIRFLWNSNTNLPRAYLSDILKFTLIGHKRAEIQSKEVNRDLWRKNWYYVTAKVTNFNRFRASAVSSHLAKTASKSVHVMLIRVIVHSYTCIFICLHSFFETPYNIYDFIYAFIFSYA